MTDPNFSRDPAFRTAQLGIEFNDGKIGDILYNHALGTYIRNIK